MATKTKYSGLLNKVVKFVRHPTKDWSELDEIDAPVAPEVAAVAGVAADLDSGYTKQALREMIERKRKNDFVRRREFDQLRRLRRNEPVISPELAGQPSFFQSSLSAYPDERASTIKKIDEIEAQMSRQWWKGQGAAAAPAVATPAATPAAPPDGVALGSSLMGEDSFASTQATVVQGDSSPASTLEYPPTMMGAQTPAPALRMPLPAALSAPSGQGPLTGSGGPISRAVSAFSSSRLFAVDPGDRLSDSDLEEAAIRFANGDDAGAESGLLAALSGNRVTPESAEGWVAALLDLYRATRQQASFERMAFDYGRRFGQAMPLWVEEGADAQPAASGEQEGQPGDTDAAWKSPAVLQAPDVLTLRSLLSTAQPPWRLDWSALETLTPEAAVALGDLVAAWCAQTVTLHFRGADVLDRVLRSATPSGDKRVDPRWWRLRLDTMRLLRLQDEFELAALDYCVTYEESPPTWVDAQCDYVPERLGGALSIADSRVRLAVDATLARSGAPVVHLDGEVLGDASAILQRFSADLSGSDRLLIDCARLVRVDFSAAGSILNWVAVRQSEGCRVEFKNVPRLVAAFFNVIGINEHAPLSLRGL
jgi:ABC-type transporter Mla MlaB component